MAQSPPADQIGDIIGTTAGLVLIVGAGPNFFLKEIDNAAGPILVDEASSATNPTLIPDRSDLTAGIGGTGGAVSLITAGLEGLKVDSAQLATLTKTHTDHTTPFTRFSNPSAAGQIPIEFFIDEAVRAKFRADVAGNVNWVAAGGNHVFYTGGDFGTGTQRWVIAASDGSLMAPTTTIVGVTTGNLTLFADTTVLISAPGGAITFDTTCYLWVPTNDASPEYRVGSSDTDEGHIRAMYDSGSQTLDYLLHSTDSSNAAANKGLHRFNVDEVDILDIDDGGINFVAGMGISIAGTDILTDSAGTATLNNIDAIDATTTLTIQAAISAIRKAITQASHGFSVGDVLKFAAGSYSLAQADSAANAEVVGMVDSDDGTNDFTLNMGGYIDALTGVAANTVYFLSPTTPGGLTATEPTTVGQVSKPVLVGDSTTSGYFVNMRGMEIGASSGLTYAAFTTDTTPTLVVNQIHDIDMSLWTQDRPLTMPSTAAVGDVVILRISTGDDTYAADIKNAASDTIDGADRSTNELTKLFITNENYKLRCIVANTDWITEIDGRIPCYAKMRLTVTSDSLAGGSFHDWSAIDMNGSSEIADRGDIMNATTGRSIVRRSNTYVCRGSLASGGNPADGQQLAVIVRHDPDGAGTAVAYTYIPAGAAIGMRVTTVGESEATDGDEFGYEAQRGDAGTFSGGSNDLTSWSIREILG